VSGTGEINHLIPPPASRATKTVSHKSNNRWRPKKGISKCGAEKEALMGCLMKYQKKWKGRFP